MAGCNLEIKFDNSVMEEEKILMEARKKAAHLEKLLLKEKEHNVFKVIASKILDQDSTSANPIKNFNINEKSEETRMQISQTIDKTNQENKNLNPEL